MRGEITKRQFPVSSVFFVHVRVLTYLINLNICIKSKRLSRMDFHSNLKYHDPFSCNIIYIFLITETVFFPPSTKNYQSHNTSFLLSSNLEYWFLCYLSNINVLYVLFYISHIATSSIIFYYCYYPILP